MQNEKRFRNFSKVDRLTSVDIYNCYNTVSESFVDIDVRIHVFNFLIAWKFLSHLHGFME